AQIGGDALETTNRDRLFVDARATARGFARPIARPTEDAREYVRFPVEHVCVGVASLRDEPDVLGDVGMRWARPLTINDFVEVTWLRYVRRLQLGASASERPRTLKLLGGPEWARSSSSGEAAKLHPLHLADSEQYRHVCAPSSSGSPSILTA